VIPAVQDDMEGCPDSDANIWLMMLIAILGMGIFLIHDLVKAMFYALHKRKVVSVKNKLMDDEFNDLQTELYGTAEYLAHCDKLSSSEGSMTNRTLRTTLSYEDIGSSDDELQV
jgi:hypothetical protein